MITTLCLSLLSLACVTPQDTTQPDPRFESGLQAYRAGGYERAGELWRGLLDAPLADQDRGRLFYNLGNVAWRSGEKLEAVGWYTASLRLDPRNADAWANLEFARSELGLEPADRGDLRSTTRRILTSLRPLEARRLALGALALLAVLLALEATRGGRLWRAASLLGAILVLIALLPWLYGRVRSGRDPALVLASPTVALRSEPRPELAAIDTLRPGQEVERIDELSGWVRVETDSGVRGWVPERAVFALEP